MSWSIGAVAVNAIKSSALLMPTLGISEMSRHFGSAVFAFISGIRPGEASKTITKPTIELGRALEPPGCKAIKVEDCAGKWLCRLGVLISFTSRLVA